MHKEVAPLVGAWIEIACFSRCRIAFFVAPLVGAWIEIYTYHIYIYLIHVAPLVGACIEITKRCRNTNSHTPSRLSWERGLKLLPAPLDSHHPLSLLSWERVLKFFSCSHCSGVMCRSSRGSVY